MNFNLGLHRISFFISGIRLDIRFRLPDIQPDIRLEKNCFKLKTEDRKNYNKTSEPFQYVENTSEIAIRNVIRFC